MHAVGFFTSFALSGVERSLCLAANCGNASQRSEEQRKGINEA